MRLRVALKIWSAIGGERDSAYTEAQKSAAVRRYDRLRTAKENVAYWHALMRLLGRKGRDALATGAPR